MRRLIIIAVSALIIQVGLIVFLNSATVDYQPFAPERKLITFDPSLVDEMLISGPADEQVRIIREEGSWRLPNLFNAPAESRRVEAVLAKLAAQQKGLAVATSSGAWKRFEVADNTFNRRLQLFQDGRMLGDIYIGTAAGFQQSHARVNGENSIHTITISGFDLEPESQSWLDRSMLRLATDDISAVTFDDFELRRDDAGSFSLAPPHQGEAVVAEQAESLFTTIADLMIESVADPAFETGTEGAEPALDFIVKTGEGSTLSYDFVAGEDQWYILTRSDLPFTFRTYAWIVEELQSFTRHKLTGEESGARSP